MLREQSRSEDHILVVEDDADLRQLVVEQLGTQGCVVGGASSMAEARDYMRRNRVDLLVLDLNLEDGDGLILCRDLRADGFDGWIMMVTARGAPIDRVLGLEIGADDYLTKPFEPRELTIRVRNLLRRARTREDGRAGREAAHLQRASLAHFGPWRLDLHQRRLIAPDDGILMLSSAEFKLLSLFINAPRQVLSREELSPSRSATAGYDRSIDVQISRLRQKLASEDGGAETILTVRSEGYVMPCTVTFE